MSAEPYKRGAVYWIRFDGPPNPDGTRHQIRESCKGMNKRQAKDHLVKRQHEVATGAYQPRIDLTLTAYLTDWLENRVGQVEESTLRVDRYTVRKHLIGHLGAIALQKLSPQDVQRLHRLMRDAGSGAKTIINAHGTLKKALADAVNLGMLQRNPVASVAPPKYTLPEIPTVSEADIKRLHGVLTASNLALPVYLALATGMRRAECLALKWGDVLWEHRALSVRRSLMPLDGGVTKEKLTKNDRGRPVVIGNELLELLRRHRAASPYTAPTDYIYPDTGGAPMDPDKFGKRLARLLSSHQITVRMHTLRHHHVTMLLHAAVSVDIVRQRVGHSTAHFTLDRYAHAHLGDQQRAAEIAEGQTLNAHLRTE